MASGSLAWKGTSSLRQVSFEQSARDFRSCRDVNLIVAVAERIAGGAGKSSLLKLLMRFYDVQAGEVLLDGYDVRDLPLDFLRRQIGLVQQEPFLFNGTVRENILYSDRQATRLVSSGGPGRPRTRFYYESARGIRKLDR